jgi:UDP-N-acetylmuramoyl-L-alanyl-D-glutamate--2,6-diaminopimelate ligase
MDRHEPLAPRAISLRQLFPTAQFLGGGDLVVTDAVEQSTIAHPDAVFAVLKGSRTDGRQFVGDALARGVPGLLVDRPLADVPAVQCVVPNARMAYAELCAALAGQPSQQLGVVGVTGTNGKTTTTWMIRAILQQAGIRAGVLGTVEYADGVQVEPSQLTTPDARTLQSWLARMVELGTQAAAVELSSHALHQHRAAGTSLQAAVVTNITQDHFDYHQTFDAYCDSKARILEHVAANGVIGLNLDDPGSWSLRERSSSFVSFGCSPAADVAAQLLEESRTGSRFRLSIHGRSLDCRLGLVGRHNVSNALAAAVAATQLGLSPEAIVTGLEQFRCVPGRLERIESPQPFDVFVDYAHTDDALRRCLAGLKSITAGRLICVFGAGGDRDRTKRPLLGRASGLADRVIVTSDNPRSEDPQQIIDEIVAGIPPQTETLVEPDRARAIRLAILAARPGDCVVIAGKGHEREQLIGHERLPFDDRAQARMELQNLLPQLRSA